jgi:DNA-binding NarL/FixJ family response regulator
MGWRDTGSAMERIKLLLVDDEAAVRRGLRMRLSIEPDIEVVGEAGDGAAAIEMVAALHPSVVLMDVEMPVMDGIAATGEITGNGTAVVMLSMHDDAATIARAMAAGAAAFVAKQSMDDSLLTAIRAAAGKGALLTDGSSRGMGVNNHEQGGNE